MAKSGHFIPPKTVSGGWFTNYLRQKVDRFHLYIRGWSLGLATARTPFLALFPSKIGLFWPYFSAFSWVSDAIFHCALKFLNKHILKCAFYKATIRKIWHLCIGYRLWLRDPMLYSIARNQQQKTYTKERFLQGDNQKNMTSMFKNPPYNPLNPLKWPKMS